MEKDKLTPETLLSVYSILNRIMINDKLEHDTSFIRVKNYITNKCCDMFLNNKVINYSKEG